MRNPAAAVARLHQVKKIGSQIHMAWMDFIKNHPKALEAANYGSSEAKIDEKILAEWSERLSSLLGVMDQDGITLKEKVEFASPLKAAMWDAWRVCARDPEQFIGQWAREGVPLGMEQSIPDAGIFPRVEAGGALETKTDMAILHPLRNYDSVEAQLDEAAIEIDRYVKKGFCKVLALEEIHSRFPAGTASRLALILKQKADGSTKRRIVIDMRRSKGNDRAKIEERIVLPRSQDIVASLRVMRAREHELVAKAKRGRSSRGPRGTLRQK